MIHRSNSLPELGAEDFYVAGQKVAPGRYHLVGSQREVSIESEDVLPATCDGRVATYVREPTTWAEIALRKRGVAAY